MSWATYIFCILAYYGSPLIFHKPSVIGRRAHYLNYRAQPKTAQGLKPCKSLVESSRPPHLDTDEQGARVGQVAPSDNWLVPPCGDPAEIGHRRESGRTSALLRSSNPAIS